MITDHLTDDIIQQFALEAEFRDEISKAHIAACKHCQLRAESYRVLFTRVAEQSPAVFDFDISTLVLSQLPTAGLNAIETLPEANQMSTRAAVNQRTVIAAHPQRGRGKSIGFIIAACLCLTGSISAALYFMQDYLVDILSGLSMMITCLIVITVLLILGFLVYDEYQKHNKQLNSLDL
jgi:hypothetical protein